MTAAHAHDAPEPYASEALRFHNATTLWQYHERNVADACQALWDARPQENTKEAETQRNRLQIAIDAIMEQIENAADIAAGMAGLTAGDRVPWEQAKATLAELDS